MNGVTFCYMAKVMAICLVTVHSAASFATCVSVDASRRTYYIIEDSKIIVKTRQGGYAEVQLAPEARDRARVDLLRSRICDGMKGVAVSKGKGYNIRRLKVLR